jgi:hypothetical protein
MPPIAHASLPTSPATDATAKSLPTQLPFGVARGVRVTLEGSDLAAVEAAAAEMKVRFGSRFAVTGRRLGADRQMLRITAGLIANVDTAMDAEGIRQWALPEASGTVPGKGGGSDGGG